MTAESGSLSLVSSLTLPGNQLTPQGYYRSKLFIAPFMTNPLVAAAGPLLSLLERLCVSPTLPPLEKIRENIEHELYAFHSRLQDREDTEELHALARYLLCATIDELLGKSYLRLNGKPVEFKAFTPSSHHETGPEQGFFDILDHIQERPNQYLDLIELAYYCLIAGFEGIQHAKTDGRQILDNLLEELFQLIQQYRVNPAPRLFKKTAPVERAEKNYKPIIGAALLSSGLLICAYLTSYFLLEDKAKNVHVGHELVARLNH